METNPRYEKALEKALASQGLQFEDLRFLKEDQISRLPRVGKKLQAYTKRKLEDRGLSFGDKKLWFVKNHLKEIRSIPPAVVIHDNDWGTYREETIILEGGKAICGLSFTGDGEPEKHRDRAWLHDLSVLPEHQGKGLATKLLDFCRRRALSAGRHRLSLWVKSGTWQEYWYKRLGFIQDPEMTRTDGNLIYNLKLTEAEDDITI